MPFHNIRIPSFIESFVISSVEYSSSMSQTLSGRENINLNCKLARHHYSASNIILSLEQFEQISNFFKARRGRYFSFLFRDLADFHSRKQLLSSYNPSKELSEFKFFKTYYDELMPYNRPIKHLEKDTVELFINNKKINALIDYENSIARLNSPLKEGENLYANFNFNIEVRFAEDILKYNFLSDNSIQILDLKFIEIF